MQGAELTFNLVAGYNVGWIRFGTLNRDFDPVRIGKSEVAFDNWAREIVELFKRIGVSIVEVGLPMPRGMATGTRGAKYVKLGVGRPLIHLYVPTIALSG
jgi:hypothetical protein